MEESFGSHVRCIEKISPLGGRFLALLVSCLVGNSVVWLLVMFVLMGWESSCSRLYGLIQVTRPMPKSGRYYSVKLYQPYSTILHLPNCLLALTTQTYPTAYPKLLLGSLTTTEFYYHVDKCNDALMNVLIVNMSMAI